MMNRDPFVKMKTPTEYTSMISLAQLFKLVASSIATIKLSLYINI